MESVSRCHSANKSTPISHSKDHYFCGLDQGRRFLPRLKVHFASGSGCNNRRDPLLADRDNYLRHKAADLHAFNSADQLISAAQIAREERSLGRGLRSGSI